MNPYMDNKDGIIDFCWDSEESQNEASAQHQIALDVLYSIGCEYSIKQDHMKQLCRIALIDFSELQRHQGVTA